MKIKSFYPILQKAEIALLAFLPLEEYNLSPLSQSRWTRNGESGAKGNNMDLKGRNTEAGMGYFLHVCIFAPGSFRRYIWPGETELVETVLGSPSWHRWALGPSHLHVGLYRNIFES